MSSIIEDPLASTRHKIDYFIQFVEQTEGGNNHIQRSKGVNYR